MMEELINKVKEYVKDLDVRNVNMSEEEEGIYVELEVNKGNIIMFEVKEVEGVINNSISYTVNKKKLIRDDDKDYGQEEIIKGLINIIDNYSSISRSTNMPWILDLSIDGDSCKEVYPFIYGMEFTEAELEERILGENAEGWFKEEEADYFGRDLFRKDNFRNAKVFMRKLKEIVKGDEFSYVKSLGSHNLFQLYYREGRRYINVRQDNKGVLEVHEVADGDLEGLKAIPVLNTWTISNEEDAVKCAHELADNVGSEGSVGNENLLKVMEYLGFGDTNVVDFVESQLSKRMSEEERERALRDVEKDEIKKISEGNVTMFKVLDVYFLITYQKKEAYGSEVTAENAFVNEILRIKEAEIRDRYNNVIKN